VLEGHGEMMSSLHETASTHTLEEPSAASWLASVWLSLVICFVAAELAGFNTFLRTWIPGRAFWVYCVSDVVLLGVLLTFAFLALRQIRRFSTPELLVVGLLLGFLTSLVAISVNPLLLGKGFGPSMNALRDPRQLAIGGLISMGWAYGAVVLFISHSLVRRSYWSLAYLFVGCASIRVVALVLNLVTEHRS
jgi:hypothetical protein